MRIVGSNVKDIWHIITPEYPPRIGGISDHSRQLSSGLRDAGDEVHVWCGGDRPGASSRECRGTDCVHWLPRGMGPGGLSALAQQLDRFPAPRRLLVQWVPHGYGWRSMNVAFCLWLWRRANLGDRVEVMLHEPYLQFGEGNFRQDGAALVHRLMTVILLRAATHVWMSTPSWAPMWRPYALGKTVPFTWLPVPANIPYSAKRDGAQALRQEYAPNRETIIGHFSTHGRLITQMLDPVIPALLRARPDRVFLLIGQAGDRYRELLIRANPDLAGRVIATGSIDAGAVSLHLLACDLLLQPYPEGITARRTSAMAGLVHGIPVVSSSGPLTEAFWARSGALALAHTEKGEMARVAEGVLAEPLLARELGSRGKSFYNEFFEAGLMIQALRNGVPGVPEDKRENKSECCMSD